jgi:hypothetical protein
MPGRLSFGWLEPLPTQWTLQMLPIHSPVILRLDASAAMRADGVAGRLNLLQIGVAMAWH